MFVRKNKAHIIISQNNNKILHTRRKYNKIERLFDEYVRYMSQINVYLCVIRKISYSTDFTVLLG